MRTYCDAALCVHLLLDPRVVAPRRSQRRFDLNEQELHSVYKQLMAAAHPDRHGQKDADERAAIADHAADITDAYTVLLSLIHI